MYILSVSGVFWIRPLWLLKIDKIFKLLDFKVSFLRVEKSLPSLLFLKYHARVLDAWIEAHIQSARKELQKKDTVSDCTIHIPVDAKLKDKSMVNIKGKNLRLDFGKNPGCTIIWNEEGAGKTSLAYQIGEWAIEGSLCLHKMMPVVIGEDLDFNTRQISFFRSHS